MKIKTVFLILVGILLSAPFVFCNGNQENNNKFVHKDPGFSFEYPKNYTAASFQNLGEVARFAADNPYKLPVFVANVYGMEEYSSQAEIAANFIKRMQKKVQGSSDFNIMEQNPIILSDGSDAYLVKINWKWVDGKTVMETALITVLKDDKMITLAGTVIAGLNQLDEITRLCMTLNMTL